jgi:hypothetical protein
MAVRATEAKTVTTLQVFLLGLMAALTPSFVVLAWMLWRAPVVGSDVEHIPALSNPRGDPANAKRRRTRRAAIRRLRRPLVRRKHRS